MEAEDFLKEGFLEALEMKELQAASIEIGHPSGQVYSKLLVCYLINNNLLEARLLWKRIPTEIKDKTPELQKIWNIGKKLFTRDLMTVNDSISSEQWPDYVAPMMEHLRVTTLERIINLISKVYSCIHINNISSALNLSEDDTIKKISKLDWKYSSNDGYVYPVRRQENRIVEQNFDRSMANLTKYVAFLESN